MNTTLALIDDTSGPVSGALAESLGTFTDRALTAMEEDTIAYHLSNSRSENTRLAYATQLKQFFAWCKDNEFVPFPAASSTVVLYVTYLAAEGHRMSKIEQAVSAIRACHSDNVHLLPSGSAISFTHPHIKAALNSIRRSLAAQGRNLIKKPRHFDQSEVKAMSVACANDGSPQAIMDRAMILLLVNAGLRSSEVVALRISDLEIDGDRGVNIHITNSKTDQFGRGETLYVGALAPHLEVFDFLKSLKEWLRVRETYPMGEGDDPLFIGFRKGGCTAHLISGVAHAISREGVTSCLLRCANRAGIETAGIQTISSHSGRHSMVTLAFARGLDSAQISKTSRHKSLKSLLAYDQTTRKEASVSVRLWQ